MTPSFLQSEALSNAGVPHGFFSRRGGVSTGDYESLNTGPGSDDDPAHVAENRARCAGALGAAPD
ncbi:MAG: laccase domain-containing protein, partial [Pseudomonadota bacterium]